MSLLTTSVTDSRMFTRRRSMSKFRTRSAAISAYRRPVYAKNLITNASLAIAPGPVGESGRPAPNDYGGRLHPARIARDPLVLAGQGHPQHPEKVSIVAASDPSASSVTQALTADVCTSATAIFCQRS